MTDKKLLDKLEQYCAYTERCSSDVLQKCKKLGIDAQQTADYLKLLEQSGFLSDRRYAASFINSKSKRGWGPAKISAALSAKKINKCHFSELLKEIDGQETLNKLKELIEKKSKTIKAADEKERKAKLIRFLLGRGYDYATIQKAAK